MALRRGGPRAVVGVIVDELNAVVDAWLRAWGRVLQSVACAAQEKQNFDRAIVKGVQGLSIVLL